MDQHTLEQQMINDGAARFHKSKQAAHARGDLSSTETVYFKEAIGEVKEAIEAAIAATEGKAGRKPTWMPMATYVGALTTAVVGLRAAFTSAVANLPYTQLCINIGRQLELEQIAIVLAAKDEALFKAMVKRAKGQGRLEKVLESFNGSLADEGIPRLPDSELVKIGGGVFNMVCQSTGFFALYMQNEGTPDQFVQVEFTQEFSESLDHKENMEQWMKPVYRFMLTEPRPWETMVTGAYFDEKIASTNPMVKTFNAVQKRKLEAQIAAGAKFVKAINLIQRVGFRINTFVVDMIQWAWETNQPVEKFPKQLEVVPEDATDARKREIRKINTERKASRAQFQSDLSEAVKFATEFPGQTIYEPAWFDWRSRVYAKPSLNHQRTDYCKAMFDFANGKVLDNDGAKWLAIHLANSGDFNKLSKKGMVERIKWVMENNDRICAMAESPKEDLWWLEADSPFCFLAAAKAWADYQRLGDQYVCHLPVAIDGSNSGLQHFSALLRDPVGAALVCLSPDQIPADVYQKVADVVKQRCHEMVDDTMAQLWLSVGIDRKLCKTCVMTYVYGSRVYGFGDHIMDCIKEMSKEKQAKLGEREQQMKAAHWMAQMVWDGVQRTVTAAANAMDWLQDTAWLLSKENKPVEWTTPVGFPVINAYYEPVTEQVELFLVGATADIPKQIIKPRVTTGFTQKLRGKKQKSSISPNAIHSMDSSHLMLSVLKAHEEGIKDYLLIHDSFACLPSDMEKFSRVVREAFVEMYRDYDLLNEIYMHALSSLSEDGRKKLKAPPSKGAFDINLVLESQYAFA